jgi:hypothetical protein
MSFGYSIRRFLVVRSIERGAARNIHISLIDVCISFSAVWRCVKKHRQMEQRRWSMDKTVADLNIVHFRKLLAVETDPVKRRTIQRLLAEQEARLAAARAQAKDSLGMGRKS